ncbi:hypothetical protein BP6252_08211 [Coleophoma cylindrospora]|uniref:ASST-domain-containing protein n=1 Tax=Coleophoma cylindrospora TaxID=1849047 RepID=A0A3D8R5I6_9HELO|nr:hypothetical protein BP6252_08211 [Coleophoma cylindrospora]
MTSYSNIFFMFLEILLISANNVYAANDLGFVDDSDLTSFVSRPDIKAPIFNVTVHNANAVTPGYWFLAPYAKINQDMQPVRYYQACQTGPSIYDSAGNLVWTGACLFKNQNACDFRASHYNGSDHLSAILYVFGEDTTGHGVVMNDSYVVTENIYPPRLVPTFNMHEFNIVEEGRIGLAIIGKAEYVDVTDLGLEQEVGWVHNQGFREFDVATGDTKFEWWTLGHVHLSASSVKIDHLDGPHPRGWNWFHMNSVDKSSDGDYMISSRYTNCIYKISGKDGHVIWRLGGTNSSFVLDGFNFSRQHDARFIEKNATTEIISFLDNGADDFNTTSSYSSALLVALDTSVTPMVATVIRRWIRPDEQLSRLRGNFQILPNRNAFVAWSANSYITEHTFDGDLVMEAQFVSRRFVTYRAYKFNFTGNPNEPPTLKSHVYGTTPKTSTTVCHVSWNGATEVATWEFYRAENSSAQQPILIGKTSRTGFETMIQFTGFESSIYAEALSSDGEVLGRSPIEATIEPSTWKVSQTVNGAADAYSESIDNPIVISKHILSEKVINVYKEEL